nr:hypothetical protein [Herbaspirillum sp. BH-1]
MNVSKRRVRISVGVKSLFRKRQPCRRSVSSV